MTFDVKEALLGRCNDIRNALDIMISHEKSDCNDTIEKSYTAHLSQERYMGMYIEALKWVINLDY